VVSNTFLPLKFHGGSDRNRLRPATAEIVLETGQATVVAWEPLPDETIGKEEASHPILRFRWDAVLRELDVERKGAGAEIQTSTYRRVAPGRWSSVTRSQLRDERSEIEITRHEDMNSRPVLFVHAWSCDCSKELFDPAPGAKSFAFGRAEPMEWTDASGVHWRGELIYPPAYEPGHAYPTVVQTHGYSPHEFLLDGPNGTTTAMAAQPLASAGFLVFQIQDKGQAITQDEQEAINVSTGYKAGIEALIARGLADRTRIGMIGFSRTAYHVLGFLARYPGVLRAAILADGIQQGYWGDLMLTNYQSDDAASLRKLTGGAPPPNALADWFARNPLYQIDRGITAVRVEAVDPSGLVGMWETFAILKAAHRPVDLVYFPAGAHVLMRPLERMGSQGGSVDWMRFWLQDAEDPDPVKASQYANWRLLKNQSNLTKSKE
jgi:hypothetical protein